MLFCLTLALGGTPAAYCAAGETVTVGIAWRADTDSEFYTNMVAALQEAGAVPVLLGQVVDKDLLYSNGLISRQGVTANDYLTTAYADKVKDKNRHRSNAAEVLQGIDAVIFTGGEDISPTLLAKPEDWHHIAAEKDYNATRDVSDYLLMSYCLEQDIPVRGFCRGMQLLAVGSGGTMIQDVPTFYAAQGLQYDYLHRHEKATPDSYRDYSPHAITVADDSIIADIFAAETIQGAPSWHHQAVLSIDGTSLQATAYTETVGYDIIEALERSDKSLVIGFQFHPEAAIVKHLNNAANKDKFMDKATALKVFTYLTDYVKSQQEKQAA